MPSFCSHQQQRLLVDFPEAWQIEAYPPRTPYSYQCTECWLTGEKARSGVAALREWLRLLRAMTAESEA